MPGVKIRRSVVGSRIKGILIKLIALVAAPPGRILFIQEMGPCVVGIESQSCGHPASEFSLQSIVVGNGIKRVPCDASELREWSAGRSVVGTQFVPWNLVNVDRERQVLAVAADIAKIHGHIASKLPLGPQRPLINSS